MKPRKPSNSCHGIECMRGEKQGGWRRLFDSVFDDTATLGGLLLLLPGWHLWTLVRECLLLYPFFHFFVICYVWVIFITWNMSSHEYLNGIFVNLTEIWTWARGSTDWSFEVTCQRSRLLSYNNQSCSRSQELTCALSHLSKKSLYDKGVNTGQNMCRWWHDR